MTGFGEGHHQQEGLAVAVEVRTINSRYFKLSVRTAEDYNSLEPRVDGVVRKSIRRGTVQVNIRVDRTQSPDDYRINTELLESYRRQLVPLASEWKSSDVVALESLLMLPGVIEDSAGGGDTEAEWPMVQKALEAAIKNLAQMREEEGRAMADDLKVNCQAIAAGLDQVQSRAPLVAEAFRERLSERLTKILAQREIALEPGDLIREVGLFAERSDISEEIVRLRSHLDQFDTIMALPESTGRKLEFLTQEMFREANTIGSKANDVEIARQVIEIKAAIERIREMIQNIE